MTVSLRYPPGATPLAPDEVAGLIPGHISTQGELDAWEQQNILEAVSWSGRIRRDIPTEEFLRKLHGRMFGETWRWAGNPPAPALHIGIAGSGSTRPRAPAELRAQLKHDVWTSPT